jgi:hypothetical protein
MKFLAILAIILGMSCAPTSPTFFGGRTVGKNIISLDNPQFQSCAFVTGWDWSMYDPNATTEDTLCICLVDYRHFPIPGKFFVAVQDESMCKEGADTKSK